MAALVGSGIVNERIRISERASESVSNRPAERDAQVPVTVP